MRAFIQRLIHRSIGIAGLALCAAVGWGGANVPASSATSLPAAPPPHEESRASHQLPDTNPDRLCGTWITVANYPTGISGNAMLALGGYLYSFGGDDGTSVTNAAYRYDGTTWTAIAPLPAERYAAVISTYGSGIYIAGGSNATGTVQNTVWRYYPATNTYSPVAPLPVGVEAAGSFWQNGHFLVIAGATGTGNTTTNLIQIYDFATNTWTIGAPFLGSVDWLHFITLSRSIYLLPSRQAPTKTYRADPTGWNDEAIADLPTPRMMYATGVLNGEIVVAGGLESGSVSNTAISWGSRVNAWIALPPMPYPAYQTAGDTLSGAFYVVGGIPTVGGSGSPITQRFTPQPCPLAAKPLALTRP